ncbi:MAG: hypothetical protein JRF63_08090, partial [Deltaproteobacteria bacterium]|nr:hypothetical protein [Deltaproteobacteria bacterium]
MAKEERDTTEVDEIMDAARSSGERPSIPGRFTIDRVAARRKLQQYQLADQWLFPLEFVRAASRRGARKIELELDRDRFSIAFDGRRYTEQDIQTLDDYFFADGEDRNTRSLRRLASAMNIARGVCGGEIEITSGDGEITNQLTTGAKHDTVEPLDEPLDGTRIEFRVNDKTALEQRAAVIADRCRYASIEISLNGDCISRGMVVDDATDSIPVPGYRHSVCGICPSLHQNRLSLVVDGVLMETVEIGHNVSSKPQPFQGCHTVLQDDRLALDLSNNKVVKDQRFDAAVRAAQETSVNVFNLLDHNVENATLYDADGAKRFHAVMGLRLPQVVLPLVGEKSLVRSALSFLRKLLGSVSFERTTTPWLKHLNPDLNRDARELMELEECISLDNLEDLIRRDGATNYTVRVRGTVMPREGKRGRDSAVIRDSWLDNGIQVARVTVSKPFWLRLHQEGREVLVKVKAGPNLVVLGEYVAGAAPPSLTAVMNNLPGWLSEHSDREISFWDLVSRGLGIKIEEHDEVVIAAQKWRKTSRGGKRTL